MLRKYKENIISDSSKTNDESDHNEINLRKLSTLFQFENLIFLQSQLK